VLRTATLGILMAYSSLAFANEPSGSEFWPPLYGYTLKISDSLLILFTMVLALFTGMLWWSTDKLWKAGEKQADLTKQALISSQRAWISVSLKADSDFRAIKGYAEVALSLTVHNIGHTPAIRAHTIMEIVSHSKMIPVQLRKLCASALEPDDERSRLVLPNESYERKWGPTYRPGADELSGAFWPHIIGCVSYQVLGDETVHQTAFVYGITAGEMKFIEYPSITPKEELVFTVQTGGFAT
jgi:hypothetical protein